MSAVLLTYKERIKKLSQKIVEIQKPIRILEAVKFPPYVLTEMKKSGYKDIPKLTAEDYASHGPLPYDPVTKRKELAELDDEIQTLLGKDDAIGKLLSSI